MARVCGSAGYENFARVRRKYTIQCVSLIVTLHRASPAIWKLTEVP